MTSMSRLVTANQWAMFGQREAFNCAKIFKSISLGFHGLAQLSLEEVALFIYSFSLS